MRSLENLRSIEIHVTAHKKPIIIVMSILVIFGTVIWYLAQQQQVGLQGHYYPNTTWEGVPRVLQIDKVPYLMGDTGYRVLSVAVYSVRWSGWILIDESGIYRFSTNSDDGSYLKIDGKTVVDNGGAHGMKKVSGKIQLEKGVYPIEVLYFQVGGYSVMQTFWTPPKKSEQRIPSMVFFPELPGKGSILFRKGSIRFRKNLNIIPPPLVKILWSLLILLVICAVILLLYYLFILSKPQATAYELSSDSNIVLQWINCHIWFSRILRTLICLIVILPLLVSIGIIAAYRVPDAMSDGEAGLFELSIRSALKGELFLGPYSRFEFNHPGPVYLYLLAPLYWLTNNSALSLDVTAMTINLLSIVGIFIIVWHCTKQWWTYLCLAFLLSQYIRYLEGILRSTWNPYVTILPFLLSIFCFSAVAMGVPVYLPLALLASSFAIQTHIGYLPAIAMVAGISCVLFIFPKLRKGLGIKISKPGNLVTISILSILIAAILWTLPLIEQFSNSPGNISKIIEVFATHQNNHSWQKTLAVSSGIFSSFLRSLFKHPVPLFPQENTLQLLRILMWGQIVLLGASFFCARRYKQNYLIASSLVCGVLTIALMLSTQRIIGFIHDHLVMWMSCLGVVNWLIIGGSLRQPLERLLTRLPGKYVYYWGIILIMSGIGITTTFVNVRTFLNKSRFRVQRRNQTTYTQGFEQITLKLLDFLQSKKVSHCLLRIIDHKMWPATTGLVLQLTKAGINAVVDPVWAFQYPPGYAMTSTPDGMLILCKPKTCEVFKESANLELVAETRHGSVFWQSIKNGGLEGTFPCEALPTFALKFTGFSATEHTYGAAEAFCLSSGKESSILIPLNAGETYNVRLTVNPKHAESMSILLNDSAIGEFHFPKARQMQEVDVQLPGELVKALNTMTFRYREIAVSKNASDYADQKSAIVIFQSISFESL